MKIRPVQSQDFEQIQKIYAYYVENTTISLEEIAPSTDELQSRHQSYQLHTPHLMRGLKDPASSAGCEQLKYPYLVAEIGGKVVGYAYAFQYRPRSAYRFTVEESVYISPAHHGQGIGQKLLVALVDECRAAGFKQMLAVIAGADNAASIKFHERMGFVKSGVLQAFGFKFGKWVDTILMQKAL